MNGQSGQHGGNQSLLANFQPQFNQMSNPAANGMGNLSGMNANQQQQLQQMFAASKYNGMGMGGGGSGGSGTMNPQMLQAYHQQQSAGGSGGGGSGGMGVNPQALMSQMGGGMNMNGRGGSGQFNPQQMFNQQSQMQRQGGGGGGSGMGGLNPAQLTSQSQNMNGMGGGGGGGSMNGMMGLSGMGGMGGMSGMGGMGGINPQALTGGASGSQGAGSPSNSNAPSNSINPSALSNSQGMQGSNANMPMNIPNLQAMLSPAQLQQLNMMSHEDRNKTIQRMLAARMQQQQRFQQQQMQQQQQQQQLDGNLGLDGMGMGGMGGMQGMNGMGGMGGGAGGNMHMRGMPNMNNMNVSMGGMQGMSQAQFAQMQMLASQGQGGNQHQQGGFDRPSSSAGPMQQGGQGQQSPTQQQAFAQQQAQSPARSQTPHGPQGSAMMQQQQMNSNMMMPPPSNIPRPPTTAPSPAPRPGTAGGSGAMGMHPQHQQHIMQSHVQSPRPGTAGTPGPRASSSMGMHPSQPQPQNVQAPLPIQPKPSTPLAGSPAPPQRPGTSQSQHASARIGSRPGTASGFGPPGQQQPQQPGGSQQQIGTPTSATYPPIAPAPASASTPSSPMVGVKRKVSGTPAPGTPSIGSGPQSGMQPQLAGDLAVMTGQSRMMPSGNPSTPVPPGMTPAQLANMNMRMHGMGVGGPGGMANVGGGGGAANLMNAAASSGIMGPPVLPRSQSQGPVDLAGLNGLPGPSLSRQGSVGDLRNLNANAANLSINTNVNPNINPAMGMGGVGGLPMMGTPPVGGSPSVGVPMVPQPQLPSTPRQGSLPPSMNSPFGQAGTPMMDLSGEAMERKMSAAGVLNGAPPITRASTGDILSGGTGAVGSSVVTASSAAVSTPSSGGGGGGGGAGLAAPTPPASSQLHQLAPLPANVALNPKITRIQIVPLIDSEKTIPALSEEEIKQVQGWMKADREYEALYKKMRDRATEEVKDVIVRSRPWWEKDPMQDPMASRRRGAKFDVIGLKSQRDERQRRPKIGRREGFKLPRVVKSEDAERPEQLVPIRLELDIDHNKMRDTFVWNLNDPIITPEIFAQSIVDDYSLAPSYLAIITKAIQDQLSDYKAHSAALLDEGEAPSVPDDIIVKGALEGEDDAWWATWRAIVRNPTFARFADERENLHSRKRRKVVKDEVAEPHVLPLQDQPMSVEDFDEDESQTVEEMRILIKLDIIVGTFHLEDQIEWDIDSQDPAPEQFAEVYAKDLGLSGEFKTAIAHSIREQVQIYQKSLFLVGHPSDGSAVQDDDLRMSLLPPLSTGARSMDQVIAFTPVFNYMSDSEIERNEKEREKELNRRKRKTPRGRRGIALPDREPPKTFRTPAIGFPEIDPATLAAVQAANAPTSRRAAAAAATLTIANMVASENGQAILPQTVSTPVTPAAPLQVKDKKPKGLMKAPSLPASVYGPRASVKAPTASTAAEPSSIPPPIENDLPLPTSAPENRGARVPLSAKRAKELEREAKEREYVDGQHPNYIDGVWHCSNCGCPDNIAVGRRKGPLGDKSQCGPCGKFWHRHRRPRPVEYNPTAEYHEGLKRKEEEARYNASRKKRPHAHVVEPPSSKAATAEPETPGRPKPDSSISGPPLSAISRFEDLNASPTKSERQASPMSTASSVSEAPLAHTLKTNGSAPPPAPETPAPPPIEAVASEPPAETASVATPGTPSVSSSAPPTVPPRAGRISPPEWLTAAVLEMQERYPDDKFEAILPRKNLNSATREWRIKCLDCPGKLYTPGPAETLQNYEVHLKNRQHRQKVNARLMGAANKDNVEGDTPAAAQS